MENHELSLIVDGQAFGGWLDVRISRGIERAAGDFQIGVTQRWPGRDERFEIPKGAACEVQIGDEKVLTGWVEVVKKRREGSSASVSISGRSKTCDLIDCSPDFATTELAGLDLAAVARKKKAGRTTYAGTWTNGCHKSNTARFAWFGISLEFSLLGLSWETCMGG